MTRPIALSTRGQRCFVCKFAPKDGVAIYQPVTDGKPGPWVCLKHYRFGLQGRPLNPGEIETVRGLDDGSIR